ncbi:L-rhamnose mutarotase [Helicobacter sp. 11S02629-2]|uniref:L-rhamnose mutarotase n=1 Tax=Helicobacter sp. 11S02629-2 TaxID=1476195 RepID=UPI000BA773B6|nr:L-rhamnose mutarotase [Helicobacter sp. 11S02629-2]PAF44897.1 amidohydrolase [Helicobacter sp. 11S02629-2]
MLEVVDSHFHIWNLDVLNLPWLKDCKAIDKSFSMDDYAKLYGSYDIDFKGGVYVEVDCDDRFKENEYIYALNSPLMLAKVMRARLSKAMSLPLGIAGVREPLHIPSNPRGRCLEKSFIEGLEVLEQNGLLFESCNRVGELEDAYNAFSQVPGVKVVLNHLGNVESLSPEYKKAMEKLASLPNLYVKVSGFKSDDSKFTNELLHFIDKTFDRSKLLYASNFPVISLYASFDTHFKTLREFFKDDPDFFAKNAKKLYKINETIVFASVIKLRPEKIAYYKHLHANPFHGVNEMIKKCGITRYEIFNRGDMLFSFMEYSGDDYNYDMAQMAKDPLTQRWWEETDPCQTRIDGAYKDEWWADMSRVYKLK